MFENFWMISGMFNWKEEKLFEGMLKITENWKILDLKVS